jgi:hypothetical protein
MVGHDAQVLGLVVGGLRLAAQMVECDELRQSLRRCASSFDETRQALSPSPPAPLQQLPRERVGP